MKTKDDRPEQATPSASSGQDLRRRAEEKAMSLEPQELDALSPEETRQTLHELRVHQIELEMQNDELRRAQAELEASRARYFDLYDLAPVGYVTLSEQALILEANLTAATLLGVARVALVKQPFSRFILKEDQDIYYLHRKQLFETGASQVCELRMLCQDGTSIWALFEATVAQDDAGTPVCRAAMSDITAHKQAEAEKAELEAQNRQLQKAKSLSIMAGAIAHHFNNQLGVVIGNLDLAMMELSQGSMPHANITAAMKASNKAAEMSGLMLTYLGQSFDKYEPLDLSEACRWSLPMLRAAMPKDMVMETDLPSPGPVISTNANHIQQVLTNLLTNAWEATGEGRGSTRLSVKMVSRADIPATHRFPQNWQPQDAVYASLEVTDEGCGIEEKDIEMLFDPFFTSKFTGRGMGLAVVLGIVRKHSGAITVESKPGRGSAFRVYFPMYAEEVDKAAQAPERRRSQDAAGRRRGGIA